MRIERANKQKPTAGEARREFEAQRRLDPKLQLPDVLSEVHEFVDHFKAAYLFALNNIAHYAKSLQEPALSRFANVDKETLLAFLSVSHNNPSLAHQSLDLYLSYDPADNWSPAFIDCCVKVDERHAAQLKASGQHYNALVKISDYAQKTMRNFKGLQDYVPR